MKDILEYSFKDPELLKQSCRHSSAKTMQMPSNERLEFLGDAVLGMIISELLYKKFPEKEEGELTIIKSEVVSQPILAERARVVELSKLIQTGKGLKDKDNLPDSILADTLEAVLGAIYLDGGLVSLREVIERLFSDKIDQIVERKDEINYKAALQEHTQKEFSIIPRYKVIKESGLQHEPIFEIVVKITDKEYGPGIGRTKKQAEQQAARIALENTPANK